MDWLEVVILALIQGVTEFLPISSSAHLIFPSQLFGWNDQGLAFDVAVHVGTLTAVMYYFKTDLVAMAKSGWQAVRLRQWNQEARLILAVIVGTVPAGLTGLLLNDWIESHLRSIAVIATTTVIFGILLGIADKQGEKVQAESNINWKTGVIVGLAQALALIPGTSRSGITITAALFLGFSREASARFSFLLSIPLILAGGSLKGVELAQSSVAVDWTAILSATTLSAIVAYLTIKGFIALLERIGMMPFVVYRMLLGLVLFGYMLL